MKNAKVVEPNDIKQILAEHFHVKPENVIKSQYSYTVILDANESGSDESSDNLV